MQPPEVSAAGRSAGRVAEPKNDKYERNDEGADGSEEDEDEPVLKYQRMGADLGKQLPHSQESIVRMAVHDSYLVSIVTSVSSMIKSMTI